MNIFYFCITHACKINAQKVLQPNKSLIFFTVYSPVLKKCVCRYTILSHIFIVEFHTSTQIYGGRRVIGISGSLIGQKPWWYWYLIPVANFGEIGEFLWRSEDPVIQIHSPRLHVGAPRIFSYILRSVQMLKRVRVWKATGNYCTYKYLSL